VVTPLDDPRAAACQDVERVRFIAFAHDGLAERVLSGNETGPDQPPSLFAGEATRPTFARRSVLMGAGSAG
jgi:hypothetical protein